jgi:hypothetical protein
MTKFEISNQEKLESFLKLEEKVMNEVQKQFEAKMNDPNCTSEEIKKFVAQKEVREDLEKSINDEKSIRVNLEEQNFKIRKLFAQYLVGKKVWVVKLGKVKFTNRPIQLLPIPEYGITLVVENEITQTNN